jgi:predicted Zn finger-like uncharacterized protein
VTGVLDIIVKIGDPFKRTTFHKGESAAMILTCPKCATRYLIEDSEIRPEGRKVRCSACGEEWRVSGPSENPVSPPAEDPPPLPPLPPELEPDPPFPEAPPPLAETVAPPLAAPEAPVLETLREEPDDGLIVAPIHTGSRAAPAPKSSLAANLGLVIIVLAALLVAAFSFRMEIVRLVPGAAGLYGAAGISVKASALPPPAAASPAASASAPDTGAHD